MSTIVTLTTVKPVPFKCKTCDENKTLWRRWSPSMLLDVSLFCSHCLEKKKNVCVDDTPLKSPEGWVPAIPTYGVLTDGYHFPVYKSYGTINKHQVKHHLY
jgi:hypothetical protein